MSTDIEQLNSPDEPNKSSGSSGTAVSDMTMDQ